MTSDQNTKTDQKPKKFKPLSLATLLKSPLTLGIIITGFFIYASVMFYSTRDQNDLEKTLSTNWLYEILEMADLKSTDIKFKLRGQLPVDTPIALITVDDASVTEIGRWPWSREKTAFVVDKAFSYGAKAIALDIIFAEAQENSSEPDKILAETFNKNRDKVILGAFANGEPSLLPPYQDYCMNESFKRMNGSLLVNPFFLFAFPFFDSECLELAYIFGRLAYFQQLKGL